MKYNKADKYNFQLVKDLIMGPNPIKLEEELLLNHKNLHSAACCGRHK